MSQDPFIGRTVGAYRIEEKLGEGGMGAVYRAVHENLRREDALKILPENLAREKPEVIQRFLVEARSAAAINNPYIVQVYDAGDADGVQYIAMEYVKGLTLKQLLQKRNGPFPLREAIKIATQAAKGLKAALREKIIHRDIKPANIMISDKGMVKVADFGLAKDLGENLKITSEGQSIGTPAYISPELGDGETADFRTDIYSLGVTLFEMATGRRPFEGDSAVRIIIQHLQSPPPDPLSINPYLDPGIRPILAKMLMKSPGQRYQSYDELIGDLNRLKDSIDGVSARSDDQDQSPVGGVDHKSAGATGTPAPGEEKKGLPVAILAAAGFGALALILAVLAVAGVFSGGRPEAQRPADPADQGPKNKADEAAAKEEKIREILLRTRQMLDQGRYQEALVVLNQVAAHDPSHRGAAELRALIQKEIDESRTSAEKENFYKQYMITADNCLTRARMSDSPEDWTLAIEAIEKALANKKTEEARTALLLAQARLDFSRARAAAGRGDFEGALSLAETAKARGAAVENLEAFLSEMKARIKESQLLAERKRHFDSLALKALKAGPGGTRAERAELLSLWREALKLADGEEDRKKALASVKTFEAFVAYDDGMEEGEKALAEARFSDALSAFEKALAAKPGDRKALDRAARAKDEADKASAAERAAAEAAERARLCSDFTARAEEAERPPAGRGKPDVDAALAFWRKAREFADDAARVKEIENRIEALRGPVLRKATQDAKAAELRKDWITVERACLRGLDVKPDDRALQAGLARVSEKVTEIRKTLGAFMEIPEAATDHAGNPTVTRAGSVCDPETGLPYEIRVRELGLEFVLVVPGKFKMGSPRTEPGHRPEENPVLNIIVPKAFYLGKYEVTQAAWKAVMELPEVSTAGDELPADMISWQDAKSFVTDFNRKAGAVENTYPFFTMPSEADWEYAARAGSQAPFYMGAAERDLSDGAWFGRNSEGKLNPVGRKVPNDFLLYDMLGNAWEWCSDAWSESLARKSEDTSEDAKKFGRVLRGGSMLSPATDCRCARRHYAQADQKLPGVGLRLCFRLFAPPETMDDPNNPRGK